MLTEIVQNVLDFFEALPGNLVRIAAWMLNLIGQLWLPIYHKILSYRADALIMLIGFLLLIVLCFFVNKRYLLWLSKSGRVEAQMDVLIQDHPIITWPVMVMKVFFYPLLVYLPFVMLADFDRWDVSFWDVSLEFSNFEQWPEFIQFSITIAMIQLLLSSIARVLSLRFVNLFRLWLNTATALACGAVLAKILILLSELVNEIPFFGPIIVGMALHVVLLSVPWLMNVAAFAPLTSWLITLIAPIFLFIDSMSFYVELKDGTICKINGIALLLYMYNT